MNIITTNNFAQKTADNYCESRTKKKFIKNITENNTENTIIDERKIIPYNEYKTVCKKNFFSSLIDLSYDDIKLFLHNKFDSLLLENKKEMLSKAIMTAARIGDLKIANLLIKFNNKINLLTSNDFKGFNNPIYHAICATDINMLTFLISTNIFNIGLTKEEHHMLMPINKAVSINSLPITKILIKNRACVNACTVGKQTPVFQAAAKGDAKILKILLKNLANPDASSTGENTPLYIASSKGHIECVSLLLQFGANPDAKSKGKQTPIFQATKYGHCEIINLLRRNKANPDAKASGADTPLYIAAQRNDTHAAKILLAKGLGIGANINANVSNKSNNTPMITAINNDSYDMIDFLLMKKNT